ncbi:poly(U)-specific endoribonuclease-like [Ptychodera flava]|uniref:poly(U)-specific endoribonuclease-like n=1 Tax=Ptychodera flava TaxID=63121 RepID=UPI00396A1B85
MGRTWCAYCKRRGHSLYEDRVLYIEIVCVKSRICGRCYQSKEFLTDLFNARSTLPKDNGDFILLCRNLWELDAGIEANKDYKINPRLNDYNNNGHEVDEETDLGAAAAVAPRKGHLFEYLRDAVLEIPIFRYFIDLLEMLGSSASGFRSDCELVGLFLDEVVQHKCGERLRSYLKERNLADGGRVDFKEKLRKTWFHQTENDGVLSCAFQRVFIGKLKMYERTRKLKAESFVSGIHNWIRFYLLEKGGDITYSGIHGKQCPSDEKKIMNVEFICDHDVIKPVGSTFFGTSPAFEICLYTAAFLCGCQEGHTYIRLGSHNVDLYCPSNVQNGDDELAICYPVED